MGELSDLSDAELEAANRRGAKTLAESPRVRSACYDGERQAVVIAFVNGCTFTVPVACVQGLAAAAAEQLAAIVVSAGGLALYWPLLDVDLYVPALLNGVFGTREWMHSLS